MTKKKRNARERRALVGALCTAAVIVAGSTFAWFTSKDEVTNRLSASAEYNVAVGENFEPPENWVPGQTINKDAGAVNTGTVDAFVRMWFDGQMRLLNQKTSGTAVAAYVSQANPFTAPTEAVTDSSLEKSGLKLMDANGNYYKLLDTTQTINPKATMTGSQEGYPDSSKYYALSEVQANQSGILAYAPNNAEYTFILNQETVLPILVSVDGGTAAPKEVTVPAGTLVHVGGTAGTAAAYTSTTGALDVTKATESVTNASGTGTATYNTVYVNAQAHDDSTTFFNPQVIEFETFTPLTDGLYLFLRNEANADQSDPEFSGYYRSTQSISSSITGTTDDKTANTLGLKANDLAVYYALNTNTGRTNRSDNTVKGATTATAEAPITVTYDGTGTNAKNIDHVVPSTNLELYTAQYTTLATGTLNWYAGAVDTGNKKQTLYAVYDVNSNNAFDAGTDIIVEVNLSNVGTDSQEWTGIGATTLATPFKDGSTNVATLDASKLTFYYNDDVEAGDSSKILVDSVKLYDGVTDDAYLAFDFDLNVNLESIQVTMDENGVEAATAVSAATGWAATGTANTAAKGAATVSSNEITSIAWSAPTA